MKLIILFSLLIVIDAGYGDDDDNIVKRAKLNPSAVNLAVETALIFDAEDARKDLSLIDNIQNFLDKLKGYLRLREQARFRTENEKEGIFTAFLKDFSRIIVNYDNESLKNLTDIVALAMEPYYYKGTVFHKIIKGRKFKSYIQDKLIDWADTDPKMLKYKMALAIATAAKENSPLTQFGNYLNKFFTEKDSKKLKKLLRKFNDHETANDMHKLVKKALEFIIFQRYNKLDDAAKLDLSYAIKNVSAFILNNYPTPNFNHTTNNPHNETVKLRAEVKDPIHKDPKANGQNAKTNRHDDDNKTVKLSAKHKDSKANGQNAKTNRHDDDDKTVKLTAKHKDSKANRHNETAKHSKIKESKTSKHNKTRRSKVARVKVNPLLPKKIVLNKNIEFNINTITEENKYTAALAANERANTTTEVQVQLWKKVSANDNNTDLENMDEVDTVILDSEDSSKKGNKKAERSNNNETENKIKPGSNNTQIDVYKQIMAINIKSENMTEIDIEHIKEMESKNNSKTDEKIEKQSEIITPEKDSFFTKGLDENEQNTEKNGNERRRMGIYFQSGVESTNHTVTAADLESDTNEIGLKIDTNSYTTAGYIYDPDERPRSDEIRDEKYEKTTRIIDVIESDKEEYQNKVHEGANKIRDLLDTVVAQRLLHIVKT